MLGREERLDPDSVIRSLDGEELDSVAPCQYPRYDYRGRPLASGVDEQASARSAGQVTSHKATPESSPATQTWDGWPAAWVYNGSGWGSNLSDSWVVPEAPTNSGYGEVIYLWNGILTTNGLLQPVLGWQAEVHGSSRAGTAATRESAEPRTMLA